MEKNRRKGRETGASGRRYSTVHLIIQNFALVQATFKPDANNVFPLLCCPCTIFAPGVERKKNKRINKQINECTDGFILLNPREPKPKYNEGVLQWMAMAIAKDCNGLHTPRALWEDAQWNLV